MLDLALVNSIRHLIIEALARTNDSHFGVGVEKINNATGSDL